MPLLCLQLSEHVAQQLHTGNHQHTAVVGHTQLAGSRCTFQFLIGQQLTAIQVAELLSKAALEFLRQVLDALLACRAIFAGP